MRDPARIDRILQHLRTYWQANPDLRLGQIVSNATPPGQDSFYVEDDIMEERLWGAWNPTSAAARSTRKAGT